MTNTILVVEDDAGILEVVRIVLEEENYKVLTAADIESAMELLSSTRPNLVLLDIWLAGENGIEIANELKGKEDTRNIPIILLSANREIEKIAQETGADSYLPKPFDIDELVEIVGKYVLSPKMSISA